MSCGRRVATMRIASRFGACGWPSSTIGRQGLVAPRLAALEERADDGLERRPHAHDEGVEVRERDVGRQRGAPERQELLKCLGGGCHAASLRAPTATCAPLGQRAHLGRRVVPWAASRSQWRAAVLSGAAAQRQVPRVSADDQAADEPAGARIW
jgi:hypothetical protein